jgi:hypothetical protein
MIKDKQNTADLFSINRISALTGLDRRTVTKRLADVKSAGERSGHSVYSLREAGPALFGQPTGSTTDPAEMTPMERDKWYASELKRRDLQKRDRELLEVAEVEEAVSTAFAAIAQSMFALPDFLERRAGMSPEQAETCQTVIHESMSDLANRLANFGVDESE